MILPLLRDRRYFSRMVIFMLLLDQSNAKELMNFAASIRDEISYWGLVEIELTGKTMHNIVQLAQRLEEKLQTSEGVLYIHDARHMLCFIRHAAPAKDCAEGFALSIADTFPAHSCEISSSALTEQGLHKVQLRLTEASKLLAGKPRRSTLYTHREARKENVIMIVDDNKEITDLLVEALGQNSTCLVLHSGDGVLNLYLEAVPDIVFMDIEMPGPSGLKSVELLRKYDHDAYILMLTAVGTTANAIAAKVKGAKGFMGKPFDPARVAREVARCPTITRP